MKRLIVSLVLMGVLISNVWALPVTISINGPIQAGATWIDMNNQLYYLWREMVLFRGEKIDTVNVWITTGGGSISEAMLIYDKLQELKRNGLKINTIGSGVCMSAGMLVLQAGDTRYATEGCLLLAHMPRFGAISTTDQFTKEDADKLSRELDDLNMHLIEKFYAPRMGKEPAQLLKYFKTEAYKMDADEAFRIGFIDAVIYEPTTLYPSKEIRQREKIKSGGR